MNYIEFFGVPGSGKSYFKKKIEKEKKNVCYIKNLIVTYFLASKNRSFFERITAYLIIFYFSNFVEFFKNFLKPERIVRKQKNRIIFEKSQPKYYSNILKYLKISNYYENILKKLSIEIKLENINFYTIIKKEINKTKQSTLFKKKIKLWFLENLLVLEILKFKKSNKYIILDEGLIHRIYILFSIAKNKNQLLNQVFKFYKQIGKAYFIDINLGRLKKNMSIRNRQNQGFLYRDENEIIKEIKNYNNYVNKIKNKVKFKKIRN